LARLSRPLPFHSPRNKFQGRNVYGSSLHRSQISEDL
jgi:hypothetical protein